VDGAPGPQGLPGTDASTSRTVSWLAGANPAGGTLFFADRAMTITAITGIVEVANGEEAATISIVKAGDGTPLSSGALVHAGVFNCNGGAGAYQELSPTAPASIAAGERLGLITTGTFAASIGSLTVMFQ
jgi:hypothetical protein